MSKKWVDVKAESGAFEAEVKEIEEWWQTDQQKHIKRYTLMDIDILKPG